MNDKREDVTALWRDYQHGLDYQVQSGLAKNLPEFVRFFEGKQWPAPTKLTRNMPRPVVNIIKMICRNKKAAIGASRTRIVYSTPRSGVDVESFNRFSDYICREIEQEKYDKEAIDDAVKGGNYNFHYYWDSEARGMLGNSTGALRVECIDTLSIFFADPTEQDEQKQRWIMISSRESVASVRAKADRDVDAESIVADEADEGDRYGTVEQEGDELCTVLTRYFRRDGEVFCEKATRSVIVNKPFPITPDIEGAMRRLTDADGQSMDAPNNDLPDRATNEQSKLMPKRARAVLYPIVVGSYERRKKSIFGLGEVEGLIPNQKAINFNLAMLLLNSQQMAWGKYIVHKDALKDQVITNEPGQVIIDHTGTGQGIRKMGEVGSSPQPLQLVDTMTQLSRSVSGSSEVMTGESIGANMSGAAIAQLQSQAQIPIEDLRDNFHKVKIKQGKVLAQFYKLFYRDAEYAYEQGEGDERQTNVGRFTGTDFADVDFEVNCEVMSGTRFSTAGDINMLDVLFARGAISLRTYIEAYPDDAISNKSMLLECIEREASDQVTQLTAQLQQAMAQLQESAQIIKDQKETVDHAVQCIRENSNLKVQLVTLQAEAEQKIGEANAQIAAGNRKIEEDERALAEVTEDATMFAQTLDNIAHDDELFRDGHVTRPAMIPAAVPGGAYGMS